MKDANSQATSLSLLARVRSSDESAWERLVYIYTPLVHRWCRRWTLQPDDVADIAQEVFSGVAGRIESFNQERPGDSFRGWLWTVTRNKISDFYRRRERDAIALGGTNAQLHLQQIPQELPEEEKGSLTRQDSPVHRTLDLIRIDFEDRTWRAFWAVAVDGRTPADVAADMGMERMAVYKAKSRVMKRLRAELDGLFEFAVTE